MKYEKEVRELVSELSSIYYEDWMDDSDKKEMRDLLMKKEGQSMSDKIKKGIDMGYPIDFQMKAIRKFFEKHQTDSGIVS